MYILDTSVDARFIDTKNRPTLVQTWRVRTHEPGNLAQRTVRSGN